MFSSSWKRQLARLGLPVLLVVAGGLGNGIAAQAATPGLDPPSVSATVNPGGSLVVSKTVHTPTIPPNPDIMFLADTTGSMGGAITSVKSGIGSIMSTVLASASTAQFGAASYKDFNCDPVPFSLDQTITASTAAVTAAVNTWTASGGCDEPEAQLFALSQLAGASPGWRSGSTRIIVWFGDAPGHDPSNGATLASTIAALTASPGTKVIAISVGANRLDLTGQATAITSATGGLLRSGVDPSATAAAILSGLTSLPATVAMVSDCTTATGGVITTTFSPASVTVTSGSDASFTETISVSSSAVQGQTYECDDWATINGNAMTDASGAIIKEHKRITIADVTAPRAACVETTNPAGKNVPSSGPNAGKSGQNPDGFYELRATDNVGIASIVVRDGGSSFVSGPFASGDHVKITQAPGVTPEDRRPGPGDIVSHLMLKGDAVLRVTDTSGNVTEVTCRVAPPPK